VVELAQQNPVLMQAHTNDSDVAGALNEE